MSKWCALFLILTIAVGVYWTIMTGVWGNRLVATELQGAVKEVTLPDMVNRLQAVRERIDNHEALVQKLSVVARDPDWSRVEQGRKDIDRLIRRGMKAMEAPGVDQSEVAESLRAEVRQLIPMNVETFRPQQRTFWTVLFWVLLVPAVAFGLLAIVRAQPV